MALAKLLRRPSANWVKVKNPTAPAVTREAVEDWRSGRPA